MNKNLIIDSLITVDETGMPQAPNIRQLIDPDIRRLYNEDKTPDKSMYIAQCIVIYYLGDPKSPANQSGLSNAEALKMAIEIANLPKTYIPNQLVLKLVQRYHEENITEAGIVVENLLKTLHNINLSIKKANDILNERLTKENITVEEIDTIMKLNDNIMKKASDIPEVIKSLNEAKENLMYEKEVEYSRGGKTITSSMNADDYK